MGGVGGNQGDTPGGKKKLILLVKKGKKKKEEGQNCYCPRTSTVRHSFPKEGGTGGEGSNARSQEPGQNWLRSCDGELVGKKKIHLKIRRRGGRGGFFRYTVSREDVKRSAEVTQKGTISWGWSCLTDHKLALNGRKNVWSQKSNEGGGKWWPFVGRQRRRRRDLVRK